MITYHPWYDHFQPAIANRCLAETAELGAGHIRIDVRWKDLMPDGRNVDEAAWNWYRHYLLAARNWYGLEPLIVLSNAPAPVLRYPVEARLAAWTRFVDALAQRAGHLCTTYQVLNEPNNPVFRIFPTQTTPLAMRYLRTLGDAMKQLDARVGPSGLRLVGIHELSDADSDAILDPEAHFGLLTSKILRRKPGFDAARQLFHALR
jgi:beta-glucosidase/6-phospho-beta-glucosidase/beta-galactosidase